MSQQKRNAIRPEVAFIWDKERQRGFWADVDQMKVRKEWLAYQKESPDRYEFITISGRQASVIYAAFGGLLLLPTVIENPFVPTTRRMTIPEIGRFLAFGIIEALGDVGYKLTAFGERLAAELHSTDEPDSMKDPK